MRTEEKLAEICETLRTNYGDFHAACRMNGVSTDFVTRWMKDDQQARDEITEAQRLGHMGLESAAIRRGVYGVEKGVWFKGEQVGTETQYSDTLLVKLMEARIPAYNKKESNGTGVNVQVNVGIMPRANTYDEWLAMKQRTLSDRAAETQLLASPATPVPEILQGEYIEVSNTELYPLKHLEGLL